MKSLWDKASEIGSKAKTFAADYLVSAEKPKKENDEQDRNFGEKFMKLKSEIDEFKKETIKQAEEKIRTLSEKYELALQDRDKNKKYCDDQIINLESIFVEKEKSYLKELTENQEKIKEKEKKISDYENSSAELNKELNKCKIKKYNLLIVQEEINQFKISNISALEKRNQEETPKDTTTFSEISTLLQQLEFIKDSITKETKNLYEINLDGIKDKIDNFFVGLKLDFSSLSFYFEKQNEKILINNTSTTEEDTKDENFPEKTTEEKQESKEYTEKDRNGNSTQAQSLKKELVELNEKIKTNLENITKFVKTVKNEIFLVIKNKIDSYNKDSFGKYTKAKDEICELFLNNNNLINDKLKNILSSEENDFKNKNKLSEEINKFNKEIENYKNLLSNKNEEYLEKEKVLISHVKQSQLKTEEIEESFKNINLENTKEKKKLSEKILDLEKSYQELNKNLEISQKTEENLSAEILEMKNSIYKTLVEKENYSKLYEIMSKNIKNYKLTLKQFFLLLLDDDIFIDLIQKTFSEENLENSPDNQEQNQLNSQMFFEKVYSLTKYIKPKIIFQFLKANERNLNNIELHRQIERIVKKKWENSVNLHSNQDNKGNKDSKNIFWEKLKKINFDSENLISLKKLQDFSSHEISLEYLENLDTEINDQDNNTIALIFSDLIIEFQSNLDFSINTLNKNNKILSELNNNLKLSKDILDDSKKNDLEKYEILNKNIQKLQQECRDFNKLEKMLKENLENTENYLKETKLENEKLSNKLKTLNNLYEELSNEKKNLIEKNSSLVQQMENFKMENTEILEQNTQRETLIRNLNDKLEISTREKIELLSQVSEIKKLNDLIAEKNSLLENKNLEIEKMRTSYSELEEFIENLKIEKEQLTDMYKKQLFELNSEVENFTENIRIQEDHKNSEKNNKFEELDKQITDLELENKYLKEQKDKMKKYSEEILLKVKNDLKDTEFLIDKRMISNILIKYFDKNTNDKIKSALLDTLANFMGFNNEERAQLGLYYNNSAGVNNENNKNDKLKDLSDELYNFILNA